MLQQFFVKNANFKFLFLIYFLVSYALAYCYSLILNTKLPKLPKTYQIYPKLTRLTQNILGSPKTYRTYTKLTGLTQNLTHLPKT